MIKFINQIFKTFSQYDLFDDGVELIGSWCFYLYQKHLGVKSFPLRTQDIDFLIPNPFRGKEHKGFIEALESLGFKREFHNDGSLYLWNAELKIEFITAEKGRGGQQAINFKKLGVSAVPLRFVSVLLNDPVTIEDHGVKILLPRPVNFCLHKLIIAARRPTDGKRIKDLQQALSVSAIVDAREMRKVFEALPPRWQSSIFKILDAATEELPLLDEEIQRLIAALQKNET